MADDPIHKMTPGTPEYQAAIQQRAKERDIKPQFSEWEKGKVREQAQAHFTAMEKEGRPYSKSDQAKCLRESLIQDNRDKGFKQIRSSRAR